MGKDERVEALKQQLLAYFANCQVDMPQREQKERKLKAKEKLKQFAQECRDLGFPLSENIDGIKKHPEYFTDLIAYSELGLLSKLTKALRKLKEKQE